MRNVQTASPDSLSPALIAPCGMDCGLCSGHLRVRDQCPGCRGDDAAKPRYCLSCTISTCDAVASGAIRFCVECATFPCARLRRLDKRYRTRYGMSMLENLARIDAEGIEAFVADERTRWTCPECGNLLCVHSPVCAQCGRIWNPPASAPVSA